MEVVPAIIPVTEAVNETVKVLDEHQLVREVNELRSLPEELEIERVARLAKKSLAKECLRTSCAAECLTMYVLDPRTSAAHAVLSEYFDGRAVAELEFNGDFFLASELSAQVAADAVFKAVVPFRGWVKGFNKSEFRAWLRNREVGPLAGPRMRPFFSMSVLESASLRTAENPEKAPNATQSASQHKPGPKPKVRLEIADKMFAELRDERRTVEGLEDDTLEVLVTVYGSSPNTVKHAREDAIARFSEFQKS
jgi:hypothetical protein